MVFSSFITISFIYDIFISNYAVIYMSCTQPFLVSSRNVPLWGGALRDDTKNGLCSLCNCLCSRLYQEPMTLMCPMTWAPSCIHD